MRTKVMTLITSTTIIIRHACNSSSCHWIGDIAFAKHPSCTIKRECGCESCVLRGSYVDDLCWLTPVPLYMRDVQQHLDVSVYISEFLKWKFKKLELGDNPPVLGAAEWSPQYMLWLVMCSHEDGQRCARVIWSPRFPGRETWWEVWSPPKVCIRSKHGACYE